MQKRYLFLLCLLAGCDSALYVTDEKGDYTTTWSQKDGVVSKDFKVNYTVDWESGPRIPSAAPQRRG